MGAGRRRRACRRGCSAMCAAVASPTSAPRPAARRRSLRGRRAGHRGRPLAAAARAPAGESRPAAAHRRDRRRRCRRMARRSRSTPCCSTRPAPRPARSAAIPTCRGSSPRPISPRSPPCSAACSTAPSTLTKPGGTLVYCTCSLEPEEGERQIAALLAREPGVRRGRSRPRGCRPRRIDHAGRRPAHPALPLPDADPRLGGLDGFYAARSRELTGLKPCWPAFRPFAMVTRATAGRWDARVYERGERVDVARFGRGTCQAVRCSWRGGAAQLRRSAQRPSAAALALHPAQDRSAADRAAGSAHRRRHPRERNLCRPLRLRRQGGDLRRPLAVRDDAAVRRMGGEPARLRLAAPSARRRIRHHARQCARAGRRMDHPAGLAGIRSPGGRTSCRAASSPGSAKRR